MRNENEILDEETRQKTDNILKENERITLPDSLSEKRVAAMLSLSEQKAEKKPSSQKVNYFVSFGAIAAALALVVTLLLVAPASKGRTLNNKDEKGVTVDNYSEIENKDEKGVTVDNYSEIEDLFATFAKNYSNNLANVEYDMEVMEKGADSFNGSVEALTESVEGSFHGKTNEQVVGVSESDILKNDGEYIYTVRNGDFYYYESEEGETVEETHGHYVDITRVEKDGTLKKESSVLISDKTGATVKEIFVEDGKLVALCTEYSTAKEKSTAVKSTAVIYDITDKIHPVLLGSYTQDGTYTSSRLISGRLVLMSVYSVNLALDDKNIKEECIPCTAVNGEEENRIAVNDICVTSPLRDSSYLVVSNVSIDNPDSFTTKAVLGAGSNAYCTASTLYVAGAIYENSDMLEEIFCIRMEDTPDTQILKFDISDGKADFLCDGKVEGYMLNQFSMDEKDGYLRVATTTGWWGEDCKNQVYVLDSSLRVVGSVLNIAKGEVAKSVRFMGNMGYLVTFEQTDPLFVLDLSNPASPVIVGEVQLPGFSAYLHPISENLLLGVGYDGDESGTNGNIKLSLFDVSDPKNPVEADKYIVTGPDGETCSDFWDEATGNFESYYLNTAATYDHKALCYDADSSTFYLPVTANLLKQTDDVYECSYDAGVLVIRADIETKKLSVVSKYYTDASYGDWHDISRATFIGDTVIAFDMGEYNTLYSFTGENTSALKLN